MLYSHYVTEGTVVYSNMLYSFPASGNPYPFASFTNLSYTRDMTWISYLEKVMTSYTIDMTWISQMRII